MCVLCVCVSVFAVCVYSSCNSVNSDSYAIVQNTTFWRDGGIMIAVAQIPVFGQMDEYIPDYESNAAYLERVEIYFSANELLGDKKAAVFLNALGGRTMLC